MGVAHEDGPVRFSRLERGEDGPVCGVLDAVGVWECWCWCVSLMLSVGVAYISMAVVILTYSREPPPRP